MAQDRFYGWADPALYGQVRMAAAQGTFSREAGFAAFHSGRDGQLQADSIW